MHRPAAKGSTTAQRRGQQAKGQDRRPVYGPHVLHTLRCECGGKLYAVRGYECFTCGWRSN